MPKVEKPRAIAVRKDDDITLPVEGGFRRQPAPADGILVETAETALFVPAEEIVECLTELGFVCCRIGVDARAATAGAAPAKVIPLKLRRRPGRTRVAKR